MKILVLGTKGMLAHVMCEYLSQKHTLDGISLRDRELTSLNNYFDRYDIVINCVGILVKESELRKDTAAYYNTYLPHYLANHVPGKVIHISTDCVFDNTFYGRSKKLGEIDSSIDVTLRTSIIGPELNPNGSGLFNWFMHQKGTVDGYTKAIWNGMTTLQLAKCIDEVIDQNLSGIHNLTDYSGIRKYDLLEAINKVFKRKIKIEPKKLGEDKRLTPTTDIQLPNYETQLKELKGWIDARPKIYSHYLR